MTDKFTQLVSTLLTVSGSPTVSAYEKNKDVDDNTIVYRLISDPTIHNHSGSEITPSRFQLDVYSGSLIPNRALVENIKSKLDMNTTDFVLSYIVNNFTIADLETGLFRTVMDFMIY